LNRGSYWPVAFVQEQRAIYLALERNVKDMEKVTYRQLFDDKVNGKRYYSFSEPITIKNRNKPVKGVVVSDAETHTERLVFTFTLNHGISEEDFSKAGDREMIDILFLPVEGTHTSPLGENNEATIEPDENYLNRLIENHYKLMEVSYA
jgi:hypothetical protein